MSSELVKHFPLEEEYKKNHGITPEDVQRLREWVNAQPHLPREHITDLDLILAYHSCGRSTEVTKQVLDLNLTLRTLFTDLFQDRVLTLNKCESALDAALMVSLPTRSREGYACIFVTFLAKNASNFIVTDVVRTVFMLIDLWQHKEGTWPGLMAIVDFANLNIGYLAAVEVKTMRQLFYFLEEALLVKMKGMHIVNAPPFMDRVMATLRLFVKNLDILQIHSSYKELDKIYPIEALPKDVGGNYLSIEECKIKMKENLKANQAFFEAEGLKRVCESRRPGKPKTVSDFFGSVEGSFKKLDID